MANYDVNIAVRAVTKKAEQELRKVERLARKVRSVGKKGFEWGSSTALARASRELKKIGVDADKATKKLRGIGERAGLGILALGAARAAKSIQHAGQQTGGFARAIEYINKLTTDTPLQAVVASTNRLRNGFKRLVPEGSAAAKAIQGVGHAANTTSGSVVNLFARLNSVPTAIKAIGVAALAIGPQLPVLVQAFNDVAQASNNLLGGAPGRAINALGTSIRRGLNRPVEEAVAAFNRLDIQLKQVKLDAFDITRLIQKDPLIVLNKLLGDTRTALESVHSSTKKAKEHAKDYVGVLRAQKKEQAAINALIREAQGLRPAEFQRSINNQMAVSPGRRAAVARFQGRGAPLEDLLTKEDRQKVAIKNAQGINTALGQRRQIIQGTNDVYNEELRIHLQKVAVIEQQERADARKLKLAIKTKAIEDARLRKAKLMQKAGNIASSGMIGGGFPLLFGQGGLAATGGGIGGVIGGAMGGGFGFAVSIIGTAIGQAIEDGEKFEKSLATVNATLRSTGQTALFTAKSIKELAKATGVTKDQARDFSAAFVGRFGKITNEHLLTIFKDVANTKAFQDALLIKDIPSAFKALDHFKDDMTRGDYVEIANLIKKNKLDEARLEIFERGLQLRKDIASDDAKHIGLMERFMFVLNRVAAYSAGVPSHELSRVAPTPGQRVRKDLAKIDKASGALENSFSSMTETELGKLFANPAVMKDIVDQGKNLQKVMKDVSKSVSEINDKGREKAKYEEKYALLISKGSTPALAKQLIAIEAESDEYDRQLKAQIKILDAEITSTELKLKAAKAIKGETEEYERLVEILNEALAKKADLQDLEDTNVGGTKVKTDADRVREEITKIRGEFNTLMDPVYRLTTISKAMGDSFTESFKGIVKGSMTAQQALANMFQRVADAFLNMAAQMIAKQIQMKILGIGMSFLGGGAGTAGGSFAGASNSVLDDVLARRASGGPVTGGSPYLVGEQGPELFVPKNSGDVIPNDRLRGGSSPVNISVHVDASESSVSTDQASGAELGNLLAAAIQSEIVQQQRPGGLLA